MKLKVLLSLFVAGFAFCSVAQAQDAKTDSEKDGLKGKVKLVKTTDYLAAVKVVGDEVVVDKGNVIKHGKDLQTEIVESYDQSGYKSQAFAQEEIEDSWLYNGVYGTKTYRYVNGALQGGDWKPASLFYTYTTTNAGASLERNMYSDGTIYSEVISRFDRNGNKVSDRSSSQNITFKYNNYGNKSEKVVSDKDGKVLLQYSYYYEYDQSNNWVRCIEMLFSSPVKVVEREIVYY